MDIASLTNVSSGVIQKAAENSNLGNISGTSDSDSFSGIFQTALDNINQTNGYLSDAENEEIKWALGESENTHDLTIALQKATTSLQYTVAVRDKFLDAYKEIMQMQI